MKIFVYGTLRHGQANARRFGLIEPVETDVVLDGFDMFDLGWFPGIVPGSGSVVGDIFEIDPNTQLGPLDAYEGYPNLYTRQIVDVGDGIDGYWRGVSVYVYNNNVQGCPQVLGGNWLEKEAG